jgi:hypothetical protein
VAAVGALHAAGHGRGTELHHDRPLLPRALAQGRPPSPAPTASRSIFLKKNSNISEKWCNILQNVDKKVDETNISENIGKK